jgi:hypothetical protein
MPLTDRLAGLPRAGRARPGLARRVALGTAAAALLGSAFTAAADAAPRSLDLAVTQLTGTPSFDATAGS